MELEKVSAKARYNKLVTDRAPYLTRARRCAELTVPSLMPADGSSGSTSFTTPAQGLGAHGLRQVSSKLINALFPINTPFFRTVVDDLALADLTEGAEDKRGEIEKALSSRERAVMAEFNSSMFRPVAFEVGRQLVLSGNYLVHIPKEGKPRGWRLNSYVVDRDGSGNLLEIVIFDKIAVGALPAAVRSQVDSDQESSLEALAKDVEVYTRIARLEDGLTFEVTQEINGVVISGEYQGTYTEETLPFIALRLSYVEGENYGRSMIEEYLGDLVTLENLSAALRDGTIQGAKVVWMVHPNSTVNIRKLAATENGGFVQGDPNSVVPLRLDKQADFAVAERHMQKITERLSIAFQLHTAVQRSAERVTAEEIRYVASELDQGLGGVYSLLAEEFQLPVARLFTLRMEHKRKVPPLPQGITQTAIVTGLDALGRGNDLNNLDALIGGATQIAGPDAVARYLVVGEYFKRRGAALGIDMGGLIRSDEEIQQAEQQAQLMQMAQNLGPQAIGQMGGAARDQMKMDANAQGEPQDG